jgi:hypothetical protein
MGKRDESGLRKRAFESDLFLLNDWESGEERDEEGEDEMRAKEDEKEVKEDVRDNGSL